MGFDVGRPLAKAIEAARHSLLSWLPRPESAPVADDALPRALDQNSDVPKEEIARLLRNLPAEAFDGKRLNPAKQASCRLLIERFDSLGTNCEFGFVQRFFGGEPLDLFRFSLVSVAGLADAMESRLVELTKAENLSIDFDGDITNGQPLLGVNIRSHGFRFHAGGLPRSMSFEDVTLLQLKKITFLTRKLLEDLADAERVFVCSCEASAEADIRRLARAMRTFGPTNLLWVTLAEPGKPGGTVEPVAEGLMRGYIDRFAARETIWAVSSPIWLRLCCEAYRIHIEQKGPALP
jgi:hypothetical protein